jgi:hypothetical protein
MIRHAILGLALLLAMMGDSSGQSQRRPQQMRAAFLDKIMQQN